METKTLQTKSLINIKSKLILPALLKILKLDKVEKLYSSTDSDSGVEFVDEILSKLKIRYEISEDDLKNIPASIPFILVSNHPYGGVDGLILLSIMLKVRPDFKILANYLLENIPELKEHIVMIDPFDKKSDKSLNIPGIKKSMNLLKQGVPIGIFPAGEVSALQTSNFKLTDNMWHPVVGKMILKSDVKVLPVYFSGHNSLLFSVLGLINPKLRTAALPSELFNKRDSIKVRIGKPVSNIILRQFEDIDQLLRFLRAKTYSLGSSIDIKNHFLIRKNTSTRHAEIIEPTNQQLIEHDIQWLNKINEPLLSQNGFEVYISSASDIPNILREITRLREITFREAGEGTGHSYDSDEFDLHYKHLYIWDTKLKKIAGAYRIGEGDKLYMRFKKKGFYLNQLFKFDKNFNPYFTHSLELGRSFVVKEYQKKPFTLLLLWKGINEFINKSNGRYKYLIGPVSISNKFNSLSKDILVDYIYKNHFDKKLSEFVKPRKKHKFSHHGEGKKLLDTKLKDINLIDQMISDIEPDQSKTPVLLKKYLKQHAKIIGFNVDPKFNKSLDGLLVIKLDEIPPETFELVK